MIRRNAIPQDALIYVAGHLANASEPADFLEDNLRIQINVMGGA
jgi:hypothetical protein